MRGIIFAAALSGVALGLGCVPAGRAQQSAGTVNQAAPGPGSGQGSGSGQGKGARDRGFGGFVGGARGILGTVTEVAADHYTVKTDVGDLYTVHFSANTRILKSPPGGRRFSPDGSGRSSGTRSNDGAEADTSDVPRQAPQPIKPTDIKVGDIVSAAGEIDAAAKSVGAVVVFQIDPERAKQMHEMQANFGKTWLAGRITAIDGTRITIEGMIDHASHVIDVDENTSFKQRRDSITLADIKPGEQLRAEGSIKDGVFRATVVNAATPRNADSGTTAAPAQQ
jgi:Domain of unknown function (DUF5666)